jgi:uncharacterized protein (UPF0332 family)
VTDFSDYLGQGLVKRRRPSFRQIKKQLERARKDLGTVAFVAEEDPQWAATIAYQAMIRSGRALLFAHGFLPADGGQHKTVVTLTGRILGEKREALVQRFERLRRKRNTFFYDSEESFSQSEVRNALKAAKRLLEIIEQRVRRMQSESD